MELRQNSILRISDEKTMELVNLYEKEGCLWNTDLEDYKHRQTRHEAAERIAKKLNIKHFTSRYVVIKFKNLRNSYCQELKKVANSVKAGDDPVYKPKVFWFNKMDSFLRPHIQHFNKGKFTHKTSVKSEPTEAEEIVQFSNPEDVFVEETNYYSDSEEFEEEEFSQKRSRNSSTTSKRPRLEESRESDLSQMLKDISSHLRVMSNQSQDCHESFGKYVSAMLRSMPLHRAMEVQPHIVNLLVETALKREEKETIT
ncbi:uncharacterized protein LOC123873978 [Maniola jurtina]|uniref:uncharacterized protein LOC123873978 n=1 Tax=Maniola jurtina TaxID=191418 RepID=UPI001E68A96A|nr:uncharacterized protein LOC123873978 [Maniola jurtina]XP_045775061.1 uncharacterized protein LOC123873978 [Maniola jurtina]XP_045775063.1 uncharacterized protein LOC123873978 [Maniola jurtina]XP_045775064.1 uncharacterized protein LOC123873978 [Maniola jurtina]XP_045775065.1 uncharacterized protein LOC123873978 [Maniola jurtina]